MKPVEKKRKKSSWTHLFRFKGGFFQFILNQLGMKTKPLLIQNQRVSPPAPATRSRGWVGFGVTTRSRALGSGCGGDGPRAPVPPRSPARLLRPLPAPVCGCEHGQCCDCRRRDGKTFTQNTSACLSPPLARPPPPLLFFFFLCANV